jgi:SAM-dependent MidA family methyltransferase
MVQSGISAKKGNSQLIHTIQSEIRQNGCLTFARFMELALYDPQDGYYMTSRSQETQAMGTGKERIGWSGDFYTAPDVHPLLAKAIFKQIQEVDDLLNHPSKLTILEMGGGKGLLARDILRECELVAPEVLSRLSYVLIECSPAMRASQEHHLSEFLQRDLSVQWASSLSELESHQVIGVIFSNEFVDALPVHRVTMQDGSLKEVFVDCEGEGFGERVEKLSTDEISAYLKDSHVQFPDGYTTEVHLEAVRWIEEAARVLNRGIILTIDYGHTARDYYESSREHGTLLCYYRHTASDNPYDHVGEQDITAHVNFSGLAWAGERTGLSMTGFTNLMSFLLSLGAEQMLAGLDQESNELQSAIHLLRPNGMGETFKVFIQHKGMEAPSLQGLRFRPFFEEALLGSGS